MATVMNFRVNYVDADHDYNNYNSDYITVDLNNDYLIWSDSLADLLTHEPTAEDLNAAATVIDDVLPITVAKCLLMDYSHDVGGSYYTHLVKGMGENKRYVFGFCFDGATATIPRLEAWDDDTHTTTAKHVLGNGTPANSFVKAVKTTSSLPGAGWAGIAIAGSTYLELDDAVLTIAKDLYANVKIIIPADYATPAAETFVLTARYTYL